MSAEQGNRLRLLWVTNLPAPYRFPAWEALATRHELDVWCLGETEGNRDWPLPAPGSHGFSIRRVPSRKISRGEVTLYLPPLTLRDISTYDAVILGGWESPYYWRLAHAARRQGISTIAFYESTLASQRFSGGMVARFRKRFFGHVAAVITVGSSSTDAVLAMGIERDRIHEGFNSVDVARFARAVSERDDLGDDVVPGHRFVFVGQLIPRKNVAALLEAFALMRQRGDSLTIVGEGHLRSSLEVITGRLGVSEQVHFTGALLEEEVIGVYSRGHTLVLPSTNEVWGLVANEALAAGLHAVVTSRCGVARDIADMQGVTIVEPRVGSIAAGMQASRDTWGGPISMPEMLDQGADRLAHAVESALGGEVPSQPLDGSIRPKILWLTNIPVPYRIHTWRQLGRDAHLSVAFLARTEPNREWDLSEQLIEIRHSFVDAPAVTSGSVPLYLPSRRLLKLLRSSPFDCLVVDGWESPAYHVAVAHARRHGWRVIVLSRSTLQSRRFNNAAVNFARRRFMSRADAVVTAGRDSTEAVLDIGVERSRISESFNTVDTEWFQRTTEQIREADPPLESAGRVFLYVGQLIERKNVTSLIEAFRLMHESADRLVIVGSGPQRTELETQVAEAGISASVVFAGSLEGMRLAEAYARAHTLVLPSASEVWGLVVNEALASELQVVVSDACGVAVEVAGIDGVHVAAPTAPELARAMALTTTRRWPAADRDGMAARTPSLADVVLRAAGA